MCFLVLGHTHYSRPGFRSVACEYLNSSPFLKCGFLRSFNTPWNKTAPPGLCTGFPFARPTCPGPTCLTPSHLQAAVPLFPHQRSTLPSPGSSFLCPSSSLTCGPITTTGLHLVVYELVLFAPLEGEAVRSGAALLVADVSSEPSVNTRCRDGH